MSRPWHEFGLTGLRAALDQGEVSAEQLAGHFLERIAASSLNAFTDVRPEATLAQARAADVRIARGERAPLPGIPVAHTDHFCPRESGPYTPPTRHTRLRVMKLGGVVGGV